MGKVNKGRTMTQRELKAAKYKRFKGNKSEGQGFADVRKKRVASKYLKIVAKEKRNLKEWSEKLKKIYAEAEEDSDSKEDEELKRKAKRKLAQKHNVDDGEVKGEKVASDDLTEEGHKENKEGHLPKPKGVSKKHKTSAFYRQEKEYQQKNEEKQKRLEAIEARQRDREAAIERRRKAKSHQHKLLAKRNYKGQPNLASRMELLLERITKQQQT
jgi:hypothetical protein